MDDTTTGHPERDAANEPSSGRQEPPDDQKNEIQTNPDPDAETTTEYDFWRINYEKLVRLLVKIGPEAMRHVFNSIHSPLHLAPILSRPATSVPLKRLRNHGLITDRQWNRIYPGQRSQVSSSDFDVNLLFLLLKNISPLSPPYPDGWHGLPAEDDLSLSADLVRIQWYRMLLADRYQENGGRMEETEFRSYWEQIKQVLTRLGGPTIKAAIEKLERQQSVNQDKEDENYVKQLIDWDKTAKNIEAKEHQFGKNASNGSDMPQMMTYLELTKGNPQNNDQLQQNDESRSSKDKGHPKKNPKKRSSVNSRDVVTLSVEEIRAHEQSILTEFQKQLTETIQTDEVIPKLLQYGLLSHEEKNRIMLFSRNSERMKLITELIVRKRGNMFDKFCDAIKYKYKKLSDQLIRAKQSPLKVEKPDELTQCQSALKAGFKSTLKAIRPVPWYPDVHVPLPDFVQPYHITDYYGRILSAEDIVQPQTKGDKPHRILVEGFEGVGKSTLLNYLTYQWLHSEKYNFPAKFRLIFLIDLKKVTEDTLASIILKQCLQAAGYIRSEKEIYSLIEENQEKTLFLLDGFENNNRTESDIWDLVHGTLYPQSTIILTANSHFVTSQLRRHFGVKLVLLGVQPNTQEALIEMYSDFTQTSMDLYAGLISKITTEHNLTIQSCSLNPQHSWCMCLISQTGGSLDIRTYTSLVSNTLHALSRLYAERSEAVDPDVSSDDYWKKAVDVLKQIAFDNIRSGTFVFAQKRLLDLDDPDGILKLGLITEAYPPSGDGEQGRLYTFDSKMFEQYFAAMYLNGVELAQFRTHLNELVSEKRFHRTAVHLCGLRHMDAELDPKVEDLFGLLAESNIRSSTSPRSIARDANVSDDTPPSASATAARESSLSAITLSLECLVEDDTPAEIFALVQHSFPSTIYMKRKVHHSPLSVVGLARVATANAVHLADLELHLDHIAAYYEGFMLKVAEAIAINETLATLRLRWNSDSLLAAFLAAAFAGNRSLRTLYMTDDSRREVDGTTATVRADIWTAGTNMRHLDTMAFTHCRNPSLVTSVIHSVPDRLRTLRLNSCRLNLNGSQELMAMIEKSRSLELLDLGSVKLRSSDFLHISHGLKRNKSLTVLVLNGVRLDENVARGLAEALKLNTSLRRLELKRVRLDAAACHAIACALHENTSLTEVNMTDADVPSEAIGLLYQMKAANIRLKGFDARRFVDKPKNNRPDQFDRK